MKKETASKSLLRRTALRYSFLFALTAGLVFLPYVWAGKSFVYKVDGASQYIVYLRYMGQYLRAGLKNLLHGHFTPLMYDFTIGMGDDINAIVRFHPLDFLSLAVPSAYTEQLYVFILLLRYYLSGLSFCAFALYWSRKIVIDKGTASESVCTLNVLSGAILYVFSGYMLMRVMNHPTYAAPFILLPLLLLGAERVMEGDGRLLFPAVVAISFISNYYFMYISSLALLGYVLLRLPDVLSAQRKDERGRAFLRLLFRFAGLYLLGLGMSLITLLPTLMRYFNSYRTAQTSTAKSLWVYSDLRRYGAWILNLIAPYVSSGNGTNLNFAVTAFPVLCALVIGCRRKYRVLKGSLLLELACLLVPAGGYVLAAFNNENNRWMYLIALSLGMTLCLLTDHLAQLSVRAWRGILAFGAFYLVLALAAWRMEHTGPYYPAAAGMLALCLLVLGGMRRKKAQLRTVRGAVLLLTVGSVVLNAWMTFLPSYGNVMSQSTRRGAAFGRYTRSAAALLTELNQDSFWRAEINGVSSGKENIPLYYGVRGTSMYNSILNAQLIRELLAEDNAGLDAVTHLQDLDTRSVLEALAAVRYYVTKREGVVPTGFSTEPVISRDGVFVYENTQMLPFGYTYDSYIVEQERAALLPEEQELVLFKAASIEQEDVPALQGLSAWESAQQGTWSVPIPLPESGEKAERVSGGYLAVQKNGSITLRLEHREGSGCMLRLSGLTGPKDLSRVVIRCNGMKKTLSLRSDRQVYTIGRKEYLIDLMENPDSESASSGPLTVQITFKQAGKYGLEDAQAVYLPQDAVEQGVKERAKEGLSDVRFEENRIAAKASLSGKKLMAFQVLYQKGWTLLVDGAKTPLMKVNGCWLGAVLEPGEHEIELVYQTPGLKAGAGVSALCLLLWGILTLRKRED